MACAFRVRSFPNGNADGQFALREKDHEELHARSGNGLFFDRENLSHAVRRIDHEVGSFELQANLPVFARTARFRGGDRRLRETTGSRILMVQAHVAASTPSGVVPTDRQSRGKLPERPSLRTIVAAAPSISPRSQHRHDNNNTQRIPIEPCGFSATCSLRRLGFACSRGTPWRSSRSMTDVT